MHLVKMRPRRAAFVLGLVIGTLVALTASPALAASSNTPAACRNLGSATLSVGSRGPAVKNLQLCATELGAMPLGVDGSFGGNTGAAVQALQGLLGTGRDGVVGPLTKVKLAHATPVAMPASCGNVAACVFLVRQIIFIRMGGHVRLINTSSGSGQLYQVRKIVNGQSVGVTTGGRPVMARAITPAGLATVCNKVNASQVAPLGTLLKPSYLDYVNDGRGCTGFAIHGSASVPGTNVSHGCMRVTLALTDKVYAALPYFARVRVLRS